MFPQTRQWRASKSGIPRLTLRRQRPILVAWLSRRTEVAPMLPTPLHRSGWFLLSCAVLLQAQERSKIDCTPSFPFKDSWWGADGAYSIPLPDGRSLWIFGDTLYGDRRVVEGNEPRMVRNSIGISTCDDRDRQVDYVIRRGDKGQPQDFFQAQHKDTWYWALDGFLSTNH